MSFSPLSTYALLVSPIAVVLLAVGDLGRVATACFSLVRELEADLGAARLTGNPAGLASALLALSNATEAIPTQDLRQVAALDAFHIVAMSREHLLLHTHPSLKRRVAALNDLETPASYPG